MHKVLNKEKSYQQTVVIQAPKEDVFAALIGGIKGWWGSTDKKELQLGDILLELLNLFLVILILAVLLVENRHFI